MVAVSLETCRWYTSHQPLCERSGRKEGESHIDSHDGSDTSVLGVQVDELIERETGTDVGVDDEELFEVREDGVSDCRVWDDRGK